MLLREEKMPIEARRENRNKKLSVGFKLRKL